MTNQMFDLTTKPKPLDYLLTYKYSQDHLELLFSCIRSRGGRNNNPNCLQLKYALQKMEIVSTLQGAAISFQYFTHKKKTSKQNH